MSSNNPFASDLNDSYFHYREPPAPPTTKNNTRMALPSRPPKVNLPPPTYEEAAGTDASRREYPREKSHSSSSQRPHRSHSDGSKPHRSHRSRSDRERGDKDRRRSSKSKKSESIKAKNLDTIDKLDVTAFFGGGFHHDGPFDACTPHRNKDAKAAPVMAFPVDGPNNSIKGMSNIDTDEQMNLAFGNYVDQNEIIGRKSSVRKKLISKSSDELPMKTNGNGYTYHDHGEDYTSSLLVPKQNPSVINFDVNAKSEPVHGFQTAGLGSTTFLDGAPAPTGDSYLNSNNTLGRKKSLVQRLRKNSGGDNLSAGNSNDYSPGSDSVFEEPAGNSFIRRVKSLKVGRRER